MGVHDDTVEIDQDDCLGRRLKAAGDDAGLRLIAKPDLMVQAALCGERRAAPTSRDRWVDVAEKDVTKVEALNRSGEVVGLRQPDVVAGPVLDGKGVMMHENIVRPV